MSTISDPVGAGGVTVSGGSINDSPWTNMEITDASFASSPSSSLAAAKSKKNGGTNRSNTYVARNNNNNTNAPNNNQFLARQDEQHAASDDDDDDDEEDECCFGCCSRRRWMMRFLRSSCVLDFILGILLLVYGGLLAHFISTTATSWSPDVLLTAKVLAGVLIWMGILLLMRMIFLSTAMTCRRMALRAGGIDAHDVGCTQACSLFAVIYITTPLLIGTCIIASLSSAIFHGRLLEFLSLLLQQVVQEGSDTPPTFMTRNFVVPVLNLAVQHSQWIWLVFFVAAVVEYLLRYKMYQYHEADCYQQEAHSMVPAWQRMRRRLGRDGGGEQLEQEDGAEFTTTPRSSTGQRPWWWDRSRSFRRNRTNRAQAPNENLTEALLERDYSEGNRPPSSPPRQRQRRRAWWRLFSRNTDDDDNIRDDGSVDFASVQEEWEIRSQDNPTWWAENGDGATGALGDGLPPARADATDLSWAE